MQKTKMIFTIGPASDNEEILRKFIQIGMSVARLNFSHGTHETHKQKIDLIKKIRKELNSPTSIMLDIKGPKIRTHNFINDEALLVDGQSFTFICNDEILGDNERCSISYGDLYKDVSIGGSILVDDGLLKFRVDDVKGTHIICTVLVGGTIKNHKGVNVPNIDIKLPSITDKDKEDLIFGCEMEVDFVAASFVRKASDIVEVRNILNAHGGEHIQIIGKIESQEGVNNIDEILKEADGIMVARGDMGVEIPIERVPIIQKNIIKKCNEAGKVVITATQMLDSMIRNSLPTRAEACDICNAIFDGTDAIMLSGESASGAFPIEAATTMATIAQETEKHIDYVYLNQRLRDDGTDAIMLSGESASGAFPIEAATTMATIAQETEKHIDYVYLNQRLREPAMGDFAEAISYSACRTSNVLNAKAIVAATTSGSTARLISKYRPKCPIIAITPNEYVLRKLSLTFGIIPLLCKQFETTDEITARLISKYRPKCPIIAITPNEYVLRKLSLTFGIIPLLCKQFETTDEIISESKKVAKKLSCANDGDDILIAAGFPTTHRGGTNMLKIEKI